MGQGKVKIFEVLLFICTIRFIICPWKSRRSSTPDISARHFAKRAATAEALCVLPACNSRMIHIRAQQKGETHNKVCESMEFRVKYCIGALQILFSSPHLWMSKSSLDLSNYSVHSLLRALVLGLLKHQSLHLFAFVLNNWQSACSQSSVTLGKWVWRKFNLWEIIRRCLSSFLWFEISSPEVVLKWPDI